MALLDIIIRFQQYFWLHRLKFDRLCVVSLYCIQQGLTNDFHKERRIADSKTSKQSNYEQSYWLSMKKDLFSQTMFLEGPPSGSFCKRKIPRKKITKWSYVFSLKFHEIYIFRNIKRLVQMLLQQMSLSVKILFLLTRILPYKDQVVDFVNSVKTRILT